MENNERKQLDLTAYKAYNNAFDISERKELIAEALRTYREMFGLRQSEIAELLGIKAGTYSTYENGTREAPAEIIVRLSLIYGLSSDFLLQTTRMDKEPLETEKQIDFLQNQIDDIRKSIYDKEINPELKSLIEAMTNAFTTMGEQFKNQNNY